jgi:hypothetical protein
LVERNLAGHPRLPQAVQTPANMPENILKSAMDNPQGNKRHVPARGEVAYAASMRRKPFHTAVAAPEVNTGIMRAS